MNTLQRISELQAELARLQALETDSTEYKLTDKGRDYEDYEEIKLSLAERGLADLLRCVSSIYQGCTVEEIQEYVTDDTRAIKFVLNALIEKGLLTTTTD